MSDGQKTDRDTRPIRMSNAWDSSTGKTSCDAVTGMYGRRNSTRNRNRRNNTDM